MKKFVGVKPLKNKKGTYQVNFRPFRGAKRQWHNVTASCMQEAYARRSELMIEARQIKQSVEEQRSGLSFEEVWLVLEQDIMADSLSKKTLGGLKRVYHRLFYEFRLKRFPHITTPGQLTLPFFVEYKSYYSVQLGRFKGLRAEIQRLKCIMHRLRRLRYCSEDIIKDLIEVKTPERNKKHYPEITVTKMKELLGQIKQDRPDLYGPVYFMFRTGRRVEETTLIERRDVVWEGISPVKINIRAETTKMDRKAPLNFLDHDLQVHVRMAHQEGIKRKASFLFLNRHGKKCDQGMITRYLGQLSEEVLKERITAHYFRHRFCTECGKANLPLIDVMAVSGIKDIKIFTEYYSHSTSQGQAKVLENTKIA